MSAKSGTASAQKTSARLAGPQSLFDLNHDLLGLGFTTLTTTTTDDRRPAHNVDDPRTMSARPLTLHASALSNDEYTLYTTSLIDLAGEDEDAHAQAHDDSYYASLSISAREARAWIRGRYTDVPHASVDAVLRLFCPKLGVADLLSGGQFFAALRLVTHLRQGKPLDGNLVFVQGESCPQSAASPPRLLSRVTSHNVRTVAP